MIKIFMSVRNRLAITKHAITALEKHTMGPYQLYVYNNATNHLIDEHFEYFRNLYKQGIVSQICFTTEPTTFNAFSKASTCNFFGLQHQQDPKKMNYDFLVMMDNDMIVMPDWDERARQVWNHVKETKQKNIFVVSQLPGGIKSKVDYPLIPGFKVCAKGKLGGSGFWTVQPDFFDKVGFLPLQQLVGQHKKHDQLYWNLLGRASQGQPYILGVRPKFAIHCGPVAGSVCNILTKNSRNKNPKGLINFEGQEQNLGNMTFDEFWKWIWTEQKRLVQGW
jgi:hypothetical protein